MKEKTVQHAKRIVGFALVPLLTMVSTLALLPIVSTKFGPAGWTALSLGQSIGAFIGVIAGLAWSVVGAQAIAVSSAETRMVIYAESIKSRLAALSMLIPVGGAAAYILAPAYKWECLAFMLGTALNCLTAAWYFSGTGQSKYVLRNEALIRLTGYAAAIPVLIYTESLWAYAGILILAGLMMACANARFILKTFTSKAWRQTRTVKTIIGEHVHGMISRGLSAGQQYLGVSMISILMPQGLPVYAAIDTLQKAAANATSFYPQAFAWWVGSPLDLEGRRRRVKRMTWTTLAVGIIVLVGWILSGPLILRLIYQDEVSVSQSMHFWIAVGMASFSTSRGLAQLGLVPLGLERNVYWGSTVGALIGIPAMASGVWISGLLGAVASIGLTYGVLSIYYLALILIKSRPRTPTNAGRVHVSRLPGIGA